VKQHIVRIALGLAICLFFLGHTTDRYHLGFIDQLDNIIYDARLVLTMPRGVDDRIVILDIDEKSLQELGHWPWPRDLLAKFIDKLFDQYQIAVVGFDVVFAEADYSSGIRVLDKFSKEELKEIPGFQQAYQKLRPQLDNDGLFAKAMKGRPVVLGYYMSNERGSRRIASIPEPVLPKGMFQNRNINFTTWAGYGGNLLDFQKSAASAGHFNPFTDQDGIVRRVPMLAELDGAYYEALSLAVVRTLLGFPKLEPGFTETGVMQGGYSGLEWLRTGPLTIPVDESVCALVPFRGDRYSFPYISISDILADRVQPAQLKGRIALVGATASGLFDLRATPVNSVYAGVEVHANMIAGILDEAVKKRPLYVVGAEVVLLLIGGIAFAFLIPRLSALWATIVTAIGIALITGFNLMVWHFGLVLPLAASLLIATTIYVLNMAYGYFVESRSKRQLADRFGEYVPPELVDQMARDPGRYSMAPKSAELTILFSDVRGFTGISESLEPDALREYIDAYLTEMSMIIRSRYRGTLDKYIGDAIMAFWGAPVEDPQHARNAVLAALAMYRQCAPLNARFAQRGWPALKIGIGVNSGTVRVGNMGSRLRRAYTAMGDAVNVASRLEGRTKAYGVGILVGEVTRSRVQDVVFREIDRIKVKGKDEAITIYEPLGMEGEISRDELHLWSEVLHAYRARDWDAADMSLGHLLAMNPGCALYGLYLQKVQDKRRNPPSSGWDGVTVFDDK